MRDRKTRPATSQAPGKTDLRSVFTAIADANKWGSRESVSGEGSTMAYTYNLRHELPRFIDEFGVRSMFDAPCGDFNWMKAVDFPAGFHYVGGEIVPSLVLANRRDHATANREFIEFDIAADKFPKCDLWFCRDCLFHLPYKSIFAAIAGFLGADIPLLMTTTHINATRFRNKDIEGGDYRQIDLFGAPFHFPREVRYRIPDYVFPFPQREMCVWSKDQVAFALRRSAR